MTNLESVYYSTRSVYSRNPGSYRVYDTTRQPKIVVSIGDRCFEFISEWYENNKAPEFSIVSELQDLLDLCHAENERKGAFLFFPLYAAVDSFIKKEIEYEDLVVKISEEFAKNSQKLAESPEDLRMFQKTRDNLFAACSKIQNSRKT